MAAGADNAVQTRMRELGVKLGMAWQISRDIADFWGKDGDGATASNALNKKKSLPLIYTLENCSTSAKREIGNSLHETGPGGQRPHQSHRNHG